MECNKDEAMRAKEVAERKFNAKDFAGAKKFAMKAQNLYPALEGLSQMLSTFDVFMCASNNIDSEADWYGILGVAPSADDETIRKQYRNLALTLHPNKNTSIGAEGAFKLISEAWSLLSDNTKRASYNQRRSSQVVHQKATPPSQERTTSSGDNRLFSFTKSTVSSGKVNKNASQAKHSSASSVPQKAKPDSFWTVCHKCKMQYEYSRVYLNRTLLCPNCHQAYFAIEIPAPISNGYETSRGYAKVRRESEEALAAKRQDENTKRKYHAYEKITGASCAEHLNIGKKRRVVEQPGLSGMDQSFPGIGGVSMATASLGHGYSETVRLNRINKLSQVEIRKILKEKARTIICKKISEYKSNSMSDNASSREKAGEKAHNEKKGMKCPNMFNQKRFDTTSESLSISVPDPDFYDFDKDRTERSFEENQVWAAYDNDDGMPRYYAIIHAVLSQSPFKVRLSWLNSKTNAELGSLNWVGSGFSKTCGDFRVGRYEANDSLNSFSHTVRWAKGTRGVICIFPRKGDVWALYRNWSADWDELTPNDIIHKYDMVEVLEDYDEELGIPVTPLVKVPGFETVFRQHLNDGQIQRIPKDEMFRFSHQVPRHLLTAQEASDILMGCMELDPAATPMDILHVVADGKQDVEEVANCEQILADSEKKPMTKI